MSILTSASSSSVRRGFDYYEYDKVNLVKQLNEYEFEGYVDGSLNKPYYVKIDVKHPKKSYCDCPHANGNITCKHMVALFFTIFNDEAEEYSDWLHSEYDEDYEDDNEDYYDDFYSEDYYDEDESIEYEKPLFFEEILNQYVDDLSANELKKILKKELLDNPEKTFDLYLKNNYNKYMKEISSSYVFLDKLNKKIKKIINDTDYYNDYYDFNKIIFTQSDKRNIWGLYADSNLQSQIDNILLVPELTVYSDYKSICHFLLDYKTRDDLNKFIYILEDYFNSLKHYSIKNNIPKSNILIVIDLLRNEIDYHKAAELLLKNAKYEEYTDYLFNKYVDYNKLFSEFVKLIDKYVFTRKQYISNLLYRFVCLTDYCNKDMVYVFEIYSFLCTNNNTYLNMIDKNIDYNKVIKDIESKTKNVLILSNLYIYYNTKEKLWNLLNNESNRYLLINYVDELKEKYTDELYNFFEKQFYLILKTGKKREVYAKASVFVGSINKLDEGYDKVMNIVNDLKKSEYQKCIALFDEINKVLKK